MNIVFVYVTLSPFVKRDLEILKKYFNVKPIKWATFWDLKMILSLIRAILTSDLCFIWFADFHAAFTVFLSKILRRKSVVVVGGYEVAKVPEIGYGAMLRPWSAYIVKYVIRIADKILAVSEFNKKEILKYTDSRNVRLIYNGVDCKKFKPNSKRDNLVITVIHTISDFTKKIKGLETFIKAAKYLPDIRFIVIGKYFNSSMKYLKAQASPNLEFLGFVPNEDLVKLYQKAKVYCQLSYRESFGMALAEAMACGCVPVVTDRGALPEVVGDVGYYVPYGDPKSTAEAVKKGIRIRSE